MFRILNIFNKKHISLLFCNYIRKSYGLCLRNFFTEPARRFLFFSKSKIPTCRIRQAECHDHKSIIKFIIDYWEDDPLIEAAGLCSSDIEALVSPICDQVKQGLTIVAKTAQDDCILGVAVNCKRVPCSIDEREKFGRRLDKPKAQQIVQLYANLERGVNIYQNYCVTEAIELSCLLVRPDVRRNNFGYRLVEESMKIARKNDHKLIYMIVTNQYAARICTSLNMEKEYFMPYSGYIGCNSKPAFTPKSPHDSAMLFTSIL